MYGFGRKTREVRNRDGSLRRGFITFLSSKLNKRATLLEATQTETDEGGLSRSYTTLKTIWVGIQSVKPNKYKRWSSTEELDNVSHEIICRRSAVDGLHSQFSSAFNEAFNSMADLNPLKEDLFFSIEQGSTNKRRLFRIRKSMDNEENHEYLTSLCEEVEEQGTGFPS